MPDNFDTDEDVFAEHTIPPKPKVVKPPIQAGKIFNRPFQNMILKS